MADGTDELARDARELHSTRSVAGWAKVAIGWPFWDEVEEASDAGFPCPANQSSDRLVVGGLAKLRVIPPEVPAVP